MTPSNSVQRGSDKDNDNGPLQVLTHKDTLDLRKEFSRNNLTCHSLSS
jgi:hypothetical protein